MLDDLLLRRKGFLLREMAESLAGPVIVKR